MKVFGIPIKVDSSFFVLSFFLAASRGLNIPLLVEWLSVVFISVLLHELGHAQVARFFGLAPEIRLYSMGGLTSWKSETELTPLKNIAISLAGPTAGFLAGGVVLFAAPPLLRVLPAELLKVAYRDLLWVNIGWGIFNLLPMLPLDGGHVLLSLERWITGKQHQLFSHVISLLAALSITALALKVQSVWVAILGVWFAYSNGTFLLQRLKIQRDRKLEPKVKQVYEAIETGRLDQGLDLVSEILRSARTDWIKREASRLLIFIFIKQRKYKEAEEELIRFNGLFGSDDYLQGVFWFEKQEMAAAIPHLKAAFDQAPSYQLGLILSQALMPERRYAQVLELCGDPIMAEAVWPLSVNLQSQAFESGEYDLAARAGVLAFAQKGDPDIAYNVGCAFARASNSEQAIKWVEKAIAAGFDNKELLATDADLGSIRTLPEFESIFKRMHD